MAVDTAGSHLQDDAPAMAQRTLWAPYWQLLMNALDTKWGAITGRNIRGLL